MKPALKIDARLISNSGIGVYLQNVLENPLLQRFDLHLLYNKKDESYFKEKLGQVRVTEYNAELYSIKELLETSGKTKGAEIFWSPHYNVPLFNFAKKKITTIHDVFHLAYYNTLTAKQKLYASLMMNRAVKSSDVIFTVSNFSKSEIVKYTGCKEEKVHVIYNGIDFLKFNTRKTREFAVTSRYHVIEPFVLYVGNVKPHKNLAKALLGYKLFINKTSSFKDTKFVIVGKKDGFITGDNKVSEILSDPFFKDKVVFTGWVKDEDLPVLYQKALLFIFPSLYEGFGFPPLEAMAAGCPVISSNAACLPEIYGDAAVYFNPNSEEEISEALEKTASDNGLRSRLIEKGLSQSKKFSWEAAVRSKIQIVEKLL